MFQNCLIIAVKYIFGGSEACQLLTTYAVCDTSEENFSRTGIFF